MTRPSKLPGFTDSLRLLVERERYSLFDIGLMFGVSRQAIEQLLPKRGIEHPDVGPGRRGLMAVRVWDDERNVFAPVARCVLERKRVVARIEARRTKRETARQERRREIVTIVERLMCELGREPSWREIWQAMGGWSFEKPSNSFAARVLGVWGGPRSLSMKQRMAEFRAATGTVGRPVGRPEYTRRSA